MSNLSQPTQQYDFHSHSNYSDGELSPHELVHHALERGVRYLALTDHDTVAGIADAKQAAAGSELEVIAGLEISTHWQRHEIHIVGLNVDPNHPELAVFCQRQGKVRQQRAKEIADALARLGILDTLPAVQALARNGNIVRPHFAQVLVERGHVKHVGEAFTRYLKRGRPAYVAAKWPSLAKTVQVIHEAGGLAVLAHPLRYGLTLTKLKLLLADFKSATGDGVEVVTASQNINERLKMARLANDHQLLASQGSDFHGPSTYANLGHLPTMPSDCEPIWGRMLS